jgi:hypothetical protein
MKNPFRYGVLLAVVALAAGCATDPAPATRAETAPVAAAPVELFAVLPESGRVHAFGDTKNYFDFLAHGEVMLTRTQVGAGPGGKTLVYGITSADVKDNKPSRGEQIMGGSLPAGSGFYGEVYKGGRFYLFGELKDMKDYMAFGEVPYSFTDVGAGPKGETIVMVMNKDSYKKGKPTDRMARFKALRAK